MARQPDVVPICISFADDSVGVMSFVTAEYWAGGGVRWMREDTDEAIAADIARTAFAAEKLPVKSWRRLTADEHAAYVAHDREFRDALADDGRSLHHRMDRARARRLKRLRHERAYALQDLDRAFMVALDRVLPKLIAGLPPAERADLERVIAKRQALRDMPVTLAPDLDDAASIEDLRAIKLPE